jgi:NAD(P)-dependent dehydrogenase (short-subunit alcohol dehydrogenase family)
VRLRDLPGVTRWEVNSVLDFEREKSRHSYSGNAALRFVVDGLAGTLVWHPGGKVPVIAIIGAGPGMGLAIARTFGTQGYKVALLSRNPANQHPLVTQLADQGIEAAAFRADVLDRTSIASGLAGVKQLLGPVDVLEYSPADMAFPFTSISQLTHDRIQRAFDFDVHGAFAAVQAVLPDMQARRAGTILFTTGAASVYPHVGNEMFANFAIAGAALRAYAQALHVALAPGGIQVGHVAIGAWIGKQPSATPEAIAPLYWQLHTERDQVEKVFLATA